MNKLTRGTSLLYIICIFYLVIFFINFFLSSYFQYSPTEILSFPAMDGYCDVSTQGIGVHCFGDFYHPLGLLNKEFPWQEGLTYPPSTFYIFKIFNFLYYLSFNSKLILLLYLIIPVISTFLVIRSYTYSVKEKNIIDVFLFSLIVFCSSPFLMSLDRGNIILYCFPILLYYIHNYINSNLGKVIISVIILSLIKPVFIILALILIIEKKFFLFIKTIFLSILIHIFSFYIFLDNEFTQIKNFVETSQKFQNYTPAGKMYPANISLPNSIAFFQKYFMNVPDNKLVYTPTIFSLILLILILILVFNFNKMNSKIENLFILMLASILLPNVSFGYYLLVPYSIIIYLLILEYNAQFNRNSENDISFFNKSKRQLFFIIFYCTSFIPIPFSLNFFTAKYTDSYLSINWIFSMYFCVFLFLVYLIKSFLQNSYLKIKNKN